MLPWKKIRKSTLLVLVLLVLALPLTGCELPIKLCGDQKCDTARGETFEWCPRGCRCGNDDCDANENPNLNISIRKVHGDLGRRKNTLGDVIYGKPKK